MPSAWACKHTAERLFYTTEFDSLFMEGLCYMHADSMALAQNRFEACAKLQPKSAAVAYQLSTLYAQNNDTINSIKQLKKAVKLNPNNYYYQTALAEIYSNQGKYKEAGNIYKDLTKLFPDKDFPIYMLCKCYFMMGDYKNSIQTYSKLEKRIGLTPEISLEKIYTIALTGDTAGVEAEFAKLYQKFPLNEDLYFREGAIYQSILGENKKALACYEKALAINPEHADALRYACDLYDRMGLSAQTDATMLKIFGAKTIGWGEKKALLKAALSFYKPRANYVDIMKTIFKRLILADNGNEEIWATYNEFLVNINDIDAAIESMNACISILPSCELCHIQRYDLTKATQSHAQAEALLDKSLAAIPNSAYLLCQKAILRFLQNDTQWETYAKQSVENLNDSIPIMISQYVYNMIGNMYGETNQVEEAANYTEKAHRLDPNEVSTANNLAYYWALLGKNLDKAAQLSYQVIQKEPLNSAYLHTYGYILMKQGKLEYAKFYMHQAIEYDGGQTYELYHDYAKILEQLGLDQEAKQYFQEAEKIKQNHEKQTP